MHDIAYIRANPQAFDAALSRRGADPVADRIIALDAKKREASTKVQQAQIAQVKSVTAEMTKLKKISDESKQ